MPLTYKKKPKKVKKDGINDKIREKLGITQAQFASVLGISRSYLAQVETKKRNLDSFSSSLLTNMLVQFHELETGKQVSGRSLETRLFLNDEYKKILPGMKKLEQDCRSRIKELKKEMTIMKERARDTEYAIIVFTSVIKNLEENTQPATQDKQERQIAGLKLFKQQAYDNLLECWEPQQAKLHGRIEAIAGEARALRRYRVKVIREHNPEMKGKAKLNDQSC